MAFGKYEYEYFGSDFLEDEMQIANDMGLVSADDWTSDINLYEKPHQLIGTDDEGLLQLNREVLSELSQLEKKINVVGICGLYRTGKSYLMNWIADMKTGFDLGDTIQSETKGIWIWCRDHPKNMDEVLMLLDTEGLDDPEKGDPDHDNKLFCLTLLMSSTLIVNVKDVFNYATLDKLAFIAKLSSIVNVLDEEADESQNAKVIKVATPHLIMCIRDFFLKNEKDGKSMTPDEYLEDKLKEVDVSAMAKKQKENHIRFNDIKSSIKEYFPKRKCVTMEQPTFGENLQKIETLDESELSAAFVKDIKALQMYVYSRKPKYICNASKKPIDGADLANLITFYVKSLREDSPLKCQDAYLQAATQRNARVYKRVFSNFQSHMKKGGKLKNTQELQAVFLPAFDNACSKYREGSFMNSADELEETLMNEMAAYLEIMKVEIRERCMVEGKKKLSKMYDDMLEKNKDRYVKEETGYKNYVDDMEKLKTDFFEKKKIFDTDVLYKCFDEFTQNKKDDQMSLYYLATGQRNKQEYDKIHDEYNKRAQGQLDRILIEENRKRRKHLEDELEKLKADYEVLSKSVTKKSICSIM